MAVNFFAPTGIARPLLILLLLFSVALCQNGKDAEQAAKEDELIIRRVREQFQRPGGWVAEKNTFFGAPLSERRRFLGAVVPAEEKFTGVIKKADVPPRVLTKAGLPKSFDARKNWPKCNATIADIRNQLKCGSCWAHATASVASDKICIASNGKTIKKLSVQDLISCMPAAYVGYPSANLCGGFDVRLGMRMFANEGIVSGGEASPAPQTGCMPYTTSNGKANASDCSRNCTNKDYKITYTNDKSRGKDVVLMGHIMSQWTMNGKPMSVNESYILTSAGWIGGKKNVTGTVETLIMEEVMKNGPVSVSYDVYTDFMTYRSGIYQKTNATSLIGGHAVKLIGWGEEAGVPFWLCSNSWGTWWGEKGTFRILRGSNHCNVERYVVTVSAVP